MAKSCEQHWRNFGSWALCSDQTIDFGKKLWPSATELRLRGLGGPARIFNKATKKQCRAQPTKRTWKVTRASQPTLSSISACPWWSYQSNSQILLRSVVWQRLQLSHCTHDIERLYGIPTEWIALQPWPVLKGIYRTSYVWMLCSYLIHTSMGTPKIPPKWMYSIRIYIYIYIYISRSYEHSMKQFIYA